MGDWDVWCATPDALEACGAAIAEAAGPGALAVYLHGPLGAGKTTFARGFLRARGISGPVKSPTFTLVEPYETPATPVYHFDLYRLAGPDELFAIGIEDYFDGRAVCLVEWAERGGGCLPDPDIDVSLAVARGGRTLSARARTARGRAVLAALPRRDGRPP